MRRAVTSTGAGFQSTRPRGARLMQSLRAEIDSLFQSTRPRGARLFWSDGRAARQNVSIHAPAWGATLCVSALSPPKYVSIHAPAWGATWTVQCLPIRRYVFQSTRPRGARPKTAKLVKTVKVCFNPRARVGRDPQCWYDFCYRSVSIHAPAWGATYAREVRPSMAIVFQSTRPRGARQNRLQRLKE